MGDGVAVGVGVACGFAPPVASGAETGAGLGSATRMRIAGGGETAGLDATVPYEAPTATSMRPARAIRRHHARMCSHPPEPAPGRPHILVERAETDRPRSEILDPSRGEQEGSGGNCPVAMVGSQ